MYKEESGMLPDVRQVDPDLYEMGFSWLPGAWSYRKYSCAKRST